LHEFHRLLLQPPAGDELLRAKNALKSSIYFNLEHRSLLCEDMGRQVSCLFFLFLHHLLGGAYSQVTMYSKKYSSYESCDAIDAITTEDIVNVSHSILVVFFFFIVSLFFLFFYCQYLSFLSVGCEEIHVYHAHCCRLEQ
jgi:hypothetical protein